MNLVHELPLLVVGAERRGHAAEGAVEVLSESAEASAGGEENDHEAGRDDREQRTELLEDGLHGTPKSRWTMESCVRM